MVTVINKDIISANYGRVFTGVILEGSLLVIGKLKTDFNLGG